VAQNGRSRDSHPGLSAGDTSPLSCLHAFVLCRPSPELPFCFVRFLGWSPWHLALDPSSVLYNTRYVRILMLFNIFLHPTRSPASSCHHSGTSNWRMACGNTRTNWRHGLEKTKRLGGPISTTGSSSNDFEHVGILSGKSNCLRSPPLRLATAPPCVSLLPAVRPCSTSSSTAPHAAPHAAPTTTVICRPLNCFHTTSRQLVQSLLIWALRSDAFARPA
jgi:hypothetical protein